MIAIEKRQTHSAAFKTLVALAAVIHLWPERQDDGQPRQLYPYPLRGVAVEQAAQVIDLRVRFPV